MPNFLLHHSKGKITLFALIAVLSLLGLFFCLLGLRKKRSCLALSGQDLPEREVLLDVLKVVSAFCIVLIHSCGQGFSKTFGTSSWFGFLLINTIPRFAVPVFMMVSGSLMLGRNTPSLSVVSKKAGKAVLLLVVWNFLYFFLHEWLWHSTGGGSIKTLLAVPVKRQFSGHLWYAYFLVWMYLFTPIVSVLYHALSMKLRFYFVLISLLVPGGMDFYSTFFNLGGANILPSFHLYMTFSYIALMFLGRMIYEGISQIRHPAITGAFCALAGFFAAVIVTADWCLKQGKARDIFISENKLFIVIYSFGLFLAVASRRDSLNHLPRKVKCAVRFLAERSLGIYFFHIVVIWTFGETFSLFGHVFNRADSPCITLLFAFIYYAVTAYCEESNARRVFSEQVQYL